MNGLRFFYKSLLLAGVFTLVLSAMAIRAHASIEPTPLSRQNLIRELKTWTEQASADTSIEAEEQDLLKEFIFRLRFQVERRYDGSDASLVRILKFMKELEEAPQNRSFSQIDDFLSELIRSIEMNREPSERLLEFIKSYAKNSDLRAPLSAEDFAEQRAYLNRTESMPAEELLEEDWQNLGEVFGELNEPTTEMPAPAPSTSTTVIEEESYGSETPAPQDPPAPDQTPTP